MKKYLKQLHTHLKSHGDRLHQQGKQFFYHINLHRKKLFSHGKILIKKTDLHEMYRQWYQQVLEVKTAPHEIALGMALGLLLGTLPTLGLHILLALVIIAIFRVNKITLFLGLALLNPLVSPLIYSLSLKIGAVLFNTPSLEISFNLITWGYLKHYLKPFLVGNIILAASLAIIGYIVTYYLVKYYKQREPIEYS